MVNYKIIRRSTEKFDGKTRKGATIEIQNISTKLKRVGIQSRRNPPGRSPST